MDAMIDVRQVSKTYSARKVTALNGVDLAVKPGELFGLLGPNGAGKTTLLNICTTRVVPSAGKALISNVDVVHAPARARRFMGSVPQYQRLDAQCTVWENIYFHCRYYGFSHSMARSRANQVLEEFKLTERAKTMPSQLSGGLAQRLQIAKAVSHMPSVLFLDEPTANLDPQTRLAIWDKIRDLRNSGMTILITTHNMEEADTLCERLAIIDHGKILTCGSPQELKNKVGARTIFDIRFTDVRQEEAEGVRQMAGVSEVDVTPGGLRIHSEGKNELLPRILETIGVQRVNDITVVKPSLETVFIELTGRELRE